MITSIKQLKNFVKWAKYQKLKPMEVIHEDSDRSVNGYREHVGTAHIFEDWPILIYRDKHISVAFPWVAYQLPDLCEKRITVAPWVLQKLWAET